MDLTELKTELNTDPTGRGYAAHVATGSTSLLAALLNEVQVGLLINRSRLTGNEILSAIDTTEFVGIASEEKRANVRMLVGMSEIDPFGPAAAIISSAFGGGSATVTALAAVRTRNGSRAEQLWGEGTSVSHFDVAHALAI
jgi:hypothetical protein